MIQCVQSFLQKVRQPLQNIPKQQQWLYKTFKIICWSFQEFVNDKCHMRASALTYYTLMAIVPIFALAFGVAKGFGFENLLQNVILDNLKDHKVFASKVMDSAHTMLNNVKGGLIAGIGVFILLWTIMRIFENIEKSFQDIWHIQENRPFARRYVNYLAFMFIGPFLLIVASSLTVVVKTQLVQSTGSLANTQILTDIIAIAARVIPFMIMSFILTLLYITIPNTPIRFRHALYGGIIAAIGYQMVQTFFIQAQVLVSHYGAIYGSFAAIPFFLIWLQLSWILVFVGAEIAFTFQHFRTLDYQSSGSLSLSTDTQSVVAIRILQETIKAFEEGHGSVSSQQLENALQLPNDVLQHGLKCLVQTKLIHHTDNPYEGYVVSQNPAKLTITSVYFKLNQHGRNDIPTPIHESIASIQATLKIWQKASGAIKANTLIRDI